MIVADASIIVEVLLRTAAGQAIEEGLFASDDALHAPCLLDVEVAQVFRRSYLLAMKCAAMRLGEEFHDVDDVRFLLRYLDVATAQDAMEIVTRYFDESQIPPKTWFALEALLPPQR
jgi:predicted nucleic acid-binding protein